MIKIIFTGFFVISFMAVAVQNSAELPIAKLTLHVVDEQGGAISGAFVKMSFEKPIPRWGGGDVVSVTGTTDLQGNFTGEGHSFDTQGGQIQKEGYYTSSPESYKFDKVVEGKWQPWNPELEVTLKKIINPISMYAKKLNIEIPAFEKTLGFDLSIGDWVIPYGKGQLSDILFTAKLNRNGEHDFNYELKIAFPNKGDGIQSFKVDSWSELKSPRLAPSDGYQAEWLQNRTSKSGVEVTNIDDRRGYFFRVRTQLDKDGKIINANYGKIYGDFMKFSYYFNPALNDRNIEFNPKNNLFKNISKSEQVKSP